MIEHTIDSVPSCGQENDYRRASPEASDLVERLDGGANYYDAIGQEVVADLLREAAKTMGMLRAQLAASEARASEYFDRLGESVAKCMSIDEARQTAESQLKIARKALEGAPRPTPNGVSDPIDYMDWYFKVRRAALHSLDGGISSTDDQSERIRRTDEMLRNTSS
jgi:hypothetical protein